MWSTFKGKEDYFWERFDDSYNKKNPKARFKFWLKDSEEVMFKRPLSSSWTKEQREDAIKILEEEREDMTELEYAQEYLAKPSDDLRHLFPEDWLKRVCILEDKQSINPNFPHFLGLDIARMGKDKGTFEIIDRISPINLQHVYNEVTQKKYTTETFDRILQLNNSWNFLKIGIDAGSGSLGVGIMDFLMREGKVCRKVEALNNRKIVLDKYNGTSRGLLKEDMYNMTKSLGERGYLKLLKSMDVQASLWSVQIEFIQEKGKPTRIKIYGRDTHIAEGIIRAVWLANQKTLNTSISYI